MADENQMQTAMQLMNSLPPAPVMVLPARPYMCVGCESTTKKLSEMQRITGTRLAPQVVDIICRACWVEHLKECKQFARVICVGCKEVVLATDPHKEKSGFYWAPGSFAHVARCPACTKDEALKNEPSPVAEKIAFYKANNIPYEQ